MNFGNVNGIITLGDNSDSEKNLLPTSRQNEYYGSNISEMEINLASMYKKVAKDSIVSQESSQDRKRPTRKGDTSRSSDTFYDGKGMLTLNGKDLCDCLDMQCPGCFFPCRRCRSNKCGNECRQERQYIYESQEITGTDVVVINPYINYFRNRYG